ncbi:hypothetical protein ACIRPU_41420 [Streptomyces sp. NPDC102259]|uniref:hypothetical protein n=1 Tax=Streptomyces sp. NPDC102259 TaxID=3366148 RepID=UPI0038150257
MTRIEQADRLERLSAEHRVAVGVRAVTVRGARRKTAAAPMAPGPNLRQTRADGRFGHQPGFPGRHRG